MMGQEDKSVLEERITRKDKDRIRKSGSKRMETLQKKITT